MIKLLLVFIFIIIILFIFLKKNKINENTKGAIFYKNLILIVIIAGLLFFLATSGRFILPQLMQIIKLGLPFITKFI